MEACGLSSPPMISIVGRSGAGKTTVLERLIAELARRGVRVGALKHTHRGFDMDHEGKDTWRHRRAGARAVGIMSPTGVAVIRTLETELPLRDATALLGLDLDLVLTEGFTQAQTPKIEVVRAELGCDIRTPPDQLVAVVADCPVSAQAPQLGFDDASALADIMMGHIGRAE
jgi:molybdopterin-guanine dinucleotide biosynthesis protein B